MIRDFFETGRDGHSAFALSVYLATSELASDAQSETFTAPISQIARRAGASYKTTAKILNRFESLKLLHVERSTVPGTKEHAPSTYTMLGTPCLTLGKCERSRLPRGLNPRNNRKKYDDTRAHARTRETVATQRANGKSSSVWSLSLEEAKKDSLWPEFEAYCISNGGSPTLKGWNTWRPKQSQPKHAGLPIAQRNKIINRLNERKARIMRTFPDGKLADWAEHDLASIQQQLEEL
jgi:hypothetical protein